MTHPAVMRSLFRGLLQQVVARQMKRVDVSVESRGMALVHRLASSGDLGTARLEAEDADVIVWLVEEGLVEVDEAFVVRLRR